MIEDKKVAVIKATSRCSRLQEYAKLLRVYGRPEELLCVTGGRQENVHACTLHFPSHILNVNSCGRQAVMGGLLLMKLPVLES